MKLFLPYAVETQLHTMIPDWIYNAAKMLSRYWKITWMESNRLTLNYGVALGLKDHQFQLDSTFNSERGYTPDYLFI